MLNRLTALAALLALGTQGLAQGAQLPPAVSRAMASAGVPAQHVSIYVRDAGTNEVVVDLASETPRSPWTKLHQRSSVMYGSPPPTRYRSP